MATILCQGVLFQNIKAIIFDKDGTLANSENYLRSLGHQRARFIDAQIPGVQEPLMMAFGITNQRLNPSGLLAVGTRFENLIAAAAYIAETGENWGQALEIAQSAFERAEQPNSLKATQTPLLPGIKPLLQRLRDSGLALAILSGDTTANVVDFVGFNELQGYFSVVQGIDAPPGKPSPQPLFRTCNELGVSPSQVLVIGDSIGDIQMSQGGGTAGCIGVTWGWTGTPQLQGASALAHHINDIELKLST